MNHSDSWAECRKRLREENQSKPANSNSQPAAQPSQEQKPKPKYNSKLVCQICGKVGHSVRDCYYRDTATSAYRSVPYPKQSTEDNRQFRWDFRQNNARVNNTNELCHTTNDEAENAEVIERHDDVGDQKKLLMPRHPTQPNKSARPNQKQPTSTQNQLKTTNHTGWQSRPSTYTKETTNFVITSHSTDNYTIKPKELKRRPEVNNIKPVRQNNTMPELPNDDEQPSPPKPNNLPKKPKYEIRKLSATLQLNKKDRMLYVSLQFRAYENFGHLDTCAIQSALTEAELRCILSVHPVALLQELLAPEFKVQIANGNIVPVRKQVLLQFFIGGKVFEETFMVLPTMGNVLIGMSFFKKHSVTLDLANNIVKFQTSPSSYDRSMGILKTSYSNRKQLRRLSSNPANTCSSQW